MKNKKVSFILLLLGIIAVIYAESKFGITKMALDGTLTDKIRDLRASDQVAAVLIYLCFTILSASFLALPGITFALVAGLVFGPYLGTVLCVIGTSLGAAISFILGRYFLKDSIKPKVMKSDMLRKFLFESEGKNDIYMLMITRLVPIFPFNLQNYAYGITDISFMRYFLFSALFIIPGTAVYTFAASGLIDEEKRMTYLLIASLLLVFVVIISRNLKAREKIR